MESYFARFMKAVAIIRKEGFGTFLRLLKSKILNDRSSLVPEMIRPEEDKFNTTSRLFSRTLSSAKLSRILHQRLNHKVFILSLSQDNYTKSVGGVQLKILDEQVAANNNGLHYMHLYPRYSRPTLLFRDEPFILGINLDGKAIGYVDGHVLIQALQTIPEKELLEISIHHTMGYSTRFIQQLLAETRKERVRFWLHDFFSICPSYLLLRNDREYCHAPEIASNSCQICIYAEMRRRQQEAFNQLFHDNALEVVAPSDFALSLWKDKFPSKKYTSIVIPNADIVLTDQQQPAKGGNILKIAFIGYPVHHKGWPVWLKLTNALKDDPRLQFYLFSSHLSPSKNFRQVRISVTHKDRFKMIDVLKEKQIDVAFLWSICPETFSFTLYESLAADCYILTSKDSGNIQDYLTRNPGHGLVLKNEEELLDLFYEGEVFTQVSRYQEASRPKARMVFQ